MTLSMVVYFTILLSSPCAHVVTAAVLPLRCSTIGTTITSDSSVNTSCSDISLVNVAVRGNVTLNISIAGIAAAAGVNNVTVTIYKMSLQSGATLAIDSTDYMSPLRGGVGPFVSIMVHSLVGSNGCLVLLGTFPPGFSFLFTGGRMTADNVTAAPTFPLLDSGTNVAKMMMLANVAICCNASIIVDNSSFVVTNPSLPCIPVFFTGAAVAVYDMSFLEFRTCNMTSEKNASFYINSPIVLANSSAFKLMMCTFLGGRGAATMYGAAIQIQSNVVCTNNSSMVVSMCNVKSVLWSHTVFMPASFVFSNFSNLVITACNISQSHANAAFFQNGGTFTNCCFLEVTACSMTSGGSAGVLGGTVIWTSPITFTNSSFLAIRSCNLTSVGNGQAPFAYSISIRLTFTGHSSFLVTSSVMVGVFHCVLTVTSSSYAVMTNNSFISRNSSNPPVLGSTVVGSSSWVLWKGNRVTSFSNYSTCILSGVSFVMTAVPGTISILDNTCTCGPGCSLWNAPLVSGAGGTIYQRCNTVNGVIVTNSSLFPIGAVSAGTCGSCNAGADCFRPLTVANSSCLIIVTTGSAHCHCISEGDASNMCLPPLLPSPSAVDSTSASTSITYGGQHHMPMSLTVSTLSLTMSARPTHASSSRVISSSLSRYSMTASDSCGELGRTRFVFDTADSASSVPVTAALGASLIQISGSNSSLGGNVQQGTLLEALNAGRVVFTISLVKPLYPLAPLQAAVSTSFGTIESVTVDTFVPRLETNNAAVRITVSVLMPQTNILHMTTTVLAVRIPQQVLTLYPACGSLLLPPRGLEFGIVLSPPKPPVLSSLGAAAVTGTAVASGASSALMGNPVVAMQQSTLAAVAELSMCLFSDVDQIGLLDFGFGDDVGRGYRGAICVFVGAVGVIIAVVGLLISAVSFITAYRKHMPFRQALGDTASLLHFPGIVVVPFVTCFQPALISAMSLLRLHLSPTDLLLAGLAVVVWLLGTALSYAVTKPWFKCTIGDLQRETPLDIEARIPYIQHILGYIEWGNEWTDQSTDCFKKRYKNIFDGYAVPWYPVLEMANTGLQGLILGIRVNQFTICVAQSVSLFAVSGITLIAAVILRPAGATFDQHCLVLGKILIQALCGLALASLFVEGLDNWIQWVSAMSTMVGNAQTLVALLYFGLTTARYAKRHRIISRVNVANLDEMELNPHTAAYPYLESLLNVELSGLEEPLEPRATPPTTPRSSTSPLAEPEVVEVVAEAELEPAAVEQTDDGHFDKVTHEQIATFSPEERRAYERFLMNRKKLLRAIREGLTTARGQHKSGTTMKTWSSAVGPRAKSHRSIDIALVDIGDIGDSEKSNKKSIIREVDEGTEADDSRHFD